MTTQEGPGATRLHGPVLVVGAGLLGTSIGLALGRHGIEVWLEDAKPRNVTTARDLGAGKAAPADASTRPQLVVVAVPPDHLGQEIARALLTWPHAIVTDVGSVKAGPLIEADTIVGHPALARYVGSHPMAGSERSGPLAASSSLFEGRPWAVTAHRDADPAAVALVEDLVALCGATAVRFTPEEHDEAVARTSHLPHLVASLVAGSLADAPAEHLALSGQGVRDVTRIAAGDPVLWTQIVAANAAALTALLSVVREDLDRLISAVVAGQPDALEGVLRRGVAGTAAIPGKHGGPAQDFGSLFVIVPDRPGELARLFADSADIGVNIEDLRIDHDPGRPVGLVELTVEPARVDYLQDALEARDWTTHR